MAAVFLAPAGLEAWNRQPADVFGVRQYRADQGSSRGIMKNYRLKISRRDFEELRRLVLLDMPNEAAAFALAGVAEYGDQVDILVRRPLAVPIHVYGSE
jgi:hypothetical protein